MNKYIVEMDDDELEDFVYEYGIQPIDAKIYAREIVDFMVLTLVNSSTGSLSISDIEKILGHKIDDGLRDNPFETLCLVFMGNDYESIRRSWDEFYDKQTKEWMKKHKKKNTRKGRKKKDDTEE